jgi:rSAM/selenodomain-associated transferase 1
LRIIVFARAPVPGQAKRRLIPALGEEGAARLYQALAKACLTSACEAAVGPVELWCTPGTDHPFFAACRSEFRVSLYQQQGADLGERMAYALSQELPALIMGSDCPSLAAADLREAAVALSQGADAVLGPAHDGGYVLLGLSRIDASLFGGIAWGTDTVLQETRSRLWQLGWHWHELPLRFDIDRPDDLRWLRLSPG